MAGEFSKTRRAFCIAISWGIKKFQGKVFSKNLRLLPLMYAFLSANKTLLLTLWPLFMDGVQLPHG